jgi:lysophospholipase L1-like esterase
LTRFRPFPQFFTWLGYFVFCLALALLLLEAFACLGRAAYHKFHHPSAVSGSTSNSDLDLQAEQRRRLSEQKRNYLPYRVWGLTEWHGHYMNNDHTQVGIVRRTVNPVRAECAGRATHIWMFGGSTLYGTSVADSATIPSYLSQILNASGCFEVVNFGVEGYVSNQERIVLEEELKSGKRPDLVINYDGFNDAFTAVLEPGIVGAPIGTTELRRRLDGSYGSIRGLLRHSCAVNLMSRWLLKHKASSVPEVANAVRTVEDLEANQELIRALGKAYGFRVRSFWQPFLLDGKKVPTREEAQWIANASNPDTPFRELLPVYQEARRKAAETQQFSFLGDIFDQDAGTIYLDWVHLNPRGNEIIARKIAESIQQASAAKLQ